MKIDKSKLHNGIWYEDRNGNYIPYDGIVVEGQEDKLADEIESYHVCFPLQIREEIWFIKDCEGNSRKVEGKPHLVSNCHIGIGGGTQEAIINMVTSGDYDLNEALALYANCCERCSNVLIHKYTNGKDGYAEYSEEWKKCNTICEYCREENSDADCN